MVYLIIWFEYIEKSLHSWDKSHLIMVYDPWDKSHLIMVYDPFNVLLYSVFQYFIEDFCVYVH